MNNTNKYKVLNRWNPSMNREYDFTPVPWDLDTRLRDKQEALPSDTDQIFAEIAKVIGDVELQTGYSIYFKNQTQWNMFKDVNPVKLIKGSTNKLDMPSNACVCWLQTGSRVWRFTPQYMEDDEGDITSHSHLELHETRDQKDTWINGGVLQGPIDHMHTLSEVVWATKRIWECVYGI